MGRRGNGELARENWAMEAESNGGGGVGDGEMKSW